MVLAPALAVLTGSSTGDSRPQPLACGLIQVLAPEPASSGKGPPYASFWDSWSRKRGCDWFLVPRLVNHATGGTSSPFPFSGRSAFPRGLLQQALTSHSDHAPSGHQGAESCRKASRRAPGLSGDQSLLLPERPPGRTQAWPAADLTDWPTSPSHPASHHCLVWLPRGFKSFLLFDLHASLKQGSL